MDRAGEIRDLVEALKARGRDCVASPAKVDRPWGSYEVIARGPGFQVKRIIVEPGQALSLQLHHQRSEHWIVVRGSAEVTVGETVSLLTENESAFIPVETKHRLANPGEVPLELIEVQSGDYLGEDDIVRFDDRYGRADGNGA
jgi:mannose-1-phosphate guanylyltransferase/mannose-6-phosphate isomerase